MKRSICLSVIILLALLLSFSCEKQFRFNKGKPLIVTTIYPYELIMQQLVDTLFTIQTLLPANASPHIWSASPQDILMLGRADVVVSNGLGLETNLEKTLSRIGSKLITASDYVNKTQLISDKDAKVGKKAVETNHDQDGVNPHIWTSPDFLIQIIMGLSAELGKRYPGNKANFESNARLMIMELNQVDGKIKTLMQNYNKSAVIALHDAFVYFFRYFRIDYIGSVQPSPGKDPTPKQLKELADAISDKNIKAIFIEPQMNPQPADILAKELNLLVFKYDDLGSATNAKTISEFIWWNWNAIKAGL